MDNGTALPLLGIGIAVGGLDDSNRATYQVLDAFQRLVKEERNRFGNDGIHLNINFELGGPLVAVPPNGVRLRKFDETRGWVVVSSAVPTGIDVRDVPAFISKTLETSMIKIGQAIEVRRRKGFVFDDSNLRQLVSELRRKVQ